MKLDNVCVVIHTKSQITASKTVQFANVHSRHDVCSMSGNKVYIGCYKRILNTKCNNDAASRNEEQNKMLKQEPLKWQAVLLRPQKETKYERVGYLKNKLQRLSDHTNTNAASEMDPLKWEYYSDWH